MRKIPSHVRSGLAEDEWMKHCCLADFHCKGRVQWHHNLIFGGKQSDIPETILPLCEDWHHRYADQWDIKEKLNWIMLSRMSDEQIASISKAINYVHKKEQLIKKFGKQYTPRSL